MTTTTETLTVRPGDALQIGGETVNVERVGGDRFRVTTPRGLTVSVRRHVGTMPRHRHNEAAGKASGIQGAATSQEAT